mgnify:CR=1 FL=1|tara:strand:- start:417 stop:1529 length:1113 start_codon:yes stop_codon:yes gene_type:complete
MAYGNLKANNLIYNLDDGAGDIAVPLEQVGDKAPLANPTFTGTVAIPNITNVETAITSKAPKADPIFTGTINGAALTLSGDLTVNGTTTTINSTTLQVDDKNIELGTVGTPSDTTADGGGITLKGGTDKTITWVNSTDTWDFNQGINVTGAGTFTSFGQFGGNPSDATAVGAKASNEGYFHAARSSAAHTIWAGYTQGTNTITSMITAGGAATFNGDVQIGTASTAGTYIRVQRSDAGNVFSGNSASGNTSSITDTGAATFVSVADSKGDVRSIPQNSQGSAYTLVAADAGKHILAGDNVTVPINIFAAGDAVTIINSSNGNNNIYVATGVTMYNTADGSNGNLTLAGRGMATLLFVNSTDCYISGAGLS